MRKHTYAGARRIIWESARSQQVTPPGLSSVARRQIKAMRVTPELCLAMLHEFLRVHRTELTSRCQAKVAKRPSPASTAAGLGRGVAILIDQLVRMLRAEQPDPAVEPTSDPDALSAAIDRATAQHGGAPPQE